MISGEDIAEGSWIPTLSVSIIILLWWISRGQSARAVRIRRWYNNTRIQWKKNLGLRDDSIYRDGGAGDGANQNHKRQG